MRPASCWASWSRVRAASAWFPSQRLVSCSCTRASTGRDPVWDGHLGSDRWCPPGPHLSPQVDAMPLHADLSSGAPGCVLAPPAPALRGPHHSRLWASPSSASANARGAPRLRARISLSSWSTLASVRRSCSPDGTEALAGDRRSVWDLSSGGFAEGCQAQSRPWPMPSPRLSFFSIPGRSQSSWLKATAVLCLQAQLTVWPTAPTLTPPLLICSAYYLDGLPWPAPRPLQYLAETALLPRPLGRARSPHLLTDTFQFIIKVFTSKLSQGSPRGGHCPSFRVHPPSHSGHTGHLSHLRTALLFTWQGTPSRLKPQTCQLFKAQAPGGSPWLSPQHHSAQPLPRPTRLGQPLPLRVRSTA